MKNTRPLKLRTILSFLGLCGTLGFSGSALSFTQGCWADFYEYSNYIGPVIRIEGPAKLPSLKSVQGSDWESKIDSMVVGPKARVWLYENPNFKLTLSEMSNYPDLMKALGITKDEVNKEFELIFNPKEKIHHLGEYNFHKKTKSIKIECTN